MIDIATVKLLQLQEKILELQKQKRDIDDHLRLLNQRIAEIQNNRILIT